MALQLFEMHSAGVVPSGHASAGHGATAHLASVKASKQPQNAVMCYLRIANRARMTASKLQNLNLSSCKRSSADKQVCGRQL